jgi:sigma-B regulation protein RsbU (phosphoserine phosphatase)
MTTLPSPINNLSTDWRAQLAYIVAMMREMSLHTDPQEMRIAYSRRMRGLLPVDGTLSLSRRDLSYPLVRVTRSSRWKDDINPWKQKERLPLLEGGILADLIHRNEVGLFNDFTPDRDDPAFEYLEGHRSLAVIPMFDRGEALNMVILMRDEPNGFDPEQFPQLVWTSNLYGRVTHNLVLAEELREAYERVDEELRVVANIQRSLLPARVPCIPTLGVAAYYQTSRQAGGDYYDFFPLPDGRWGLLIADVSGHGTPAAVVMAVTHALAHTYAGGRDRPSGLLEHLNRELYRLHTSKNESFVTAFYAIYDPESRQFTYSSAGHNPPRLKRCADGSLASLDASRGLPLGITPEETYGDATHQLVPGDELVLYTDGITEAQDPAGRMFGLARLDKVLENCAVGAPDLLRLVLDELDTFTGTQAPHDDRTLLVLKVR